MLKDLWINYRFKCYIVLLNALSIFGAFATVCFYPLVIATGNIVSILVCSLLVLYVFYIQFGTTVRYMQRIAHLEKKNDELLEKVVENLIKSKP